MGEQSNLTEENVEELKKHLNKMQQENPDLQYRFYPQKKNETLQDVETRKLWQALDDLKNRPIVKDPFKWMRRWLEAYARQNDGLNVDAVMDWIYQQPMIDD